MLLVLLRMHLVWSVFAFKLLSLEELNDYRAFLAFMLMVKKLIFPTWSPVITVILESLFVIMLTMFFI